MPRILILSALITLLAAACATSQPEMEPPAEEIPVAEPIPAPPEPPVPEPGTACLLGLAAVVWTWRRMRRGR